MSKVCNESCSPDGWHFKQCGRPVKYEIIRIDTYNVPVKKVKGYRCGLHARKYQEKRKLEKGEL